MIEVLVVTDSRARGVEDREVAGKARRRGEKAIERPGRTQFVESPSECRIVCLTHLRQ